LKSTTLRTPPPAPELTTLTLSAPATVFEAVTESNGAPEREKKKKKEKEKKGSAAQR
jgi:hypothetical protein